MGRPNMYPQKFPKDNPSNAEKKVFEYFEKNAPENWYIIHSFRLKEHEQVVFGESDFVVIAPRFGIFILEIKGGRISFDGSLWHFTNKSGDETTKQRGPFQQAREGMHAVEKVLVEKMGDEYKRTKIRYHYGVIFTDQYGFPVKLMAEDEPWRLMQRNDEYGDNYCKFIESLYSNFKKELNDLGKSQPSPLSEETSKQIVKCLRSEFSPISPERSFIESTEEDIQQYTDEQMECIDDIFANPRIVVLGGAGTGKTVLAVKDANEINSDYENVGFFCFTNNLARDIRKRIHNDNVKVYSIHGYLKEICKGRFTKEDEEEKDFYDVYLPLLATEILLEKEIKFDRIIVDEFQDLCTDAYLDLFDIMLDGGLSNGRFAFYGDFSHQAIFRKDSKLELLDKRTFFTKKVLKINCRNTRYIGNEIINVTGYDEQNYRLNIDGQKVVYSAWKDEEEEFGNLRDILNELGKSGIESSSIVILSPYKRENSIVGKKDNKHFLIGDYGENPNQYRALFSTIHAFKGLQSSIVIITDVNDYSNNHLMYVAISRAKSKLYVLESTEARKQRINNLIRRS